MKEPSYRYGKGWSVGCVRKKNPNFPYNAIAIKDGVPISAGCRATYEEAAKAAVGAAYHYGSLNVTQSAKFFAKMGWVFNTNDLVTFAPNTYDKGWYVRRQDDRWISYTGYHTRVDGKRKFILKTVCARMSKALAVEKAIEAAKLTDIYNEDKTVLWLKRNGLEELIKKARVA